MWLSGKHKFVLIKFFWAPFLVHHFRSHDMSLIIWFRQYLSRCLLHVCTNRAKNLLFLHVVDCSKFVTVLKSFFLILLTWNFFPLSQTRIATSCRNCKARKWADLKEKAGWSLKEGRKRRQVGIRYLDHTTDYSTKQQLGPSAQFSPIYGFVPLPGLARLQSWRNGTHFSFAPAFATAARPRSRQEFASCCQSSPPALIVLPSSTRRRPSLRVRRHITSSTIGSQDGMPEFRWACMDHGCAVVGPREEGPAGPEAGTAEQCIGEGRHGMVVAHRASGPCFRWIAGRPAGVMIWSVASCLAPCSLSCHSSKQVAYFCFFFNDEVAKEDRSYPVSSALAFMLIGIWIKP